MTCKSLGGTVPALRGGAWTWTVALFTAVVASGSMSHAQGPAVAPPPAGPAIAPAHAGPVVAPPPAGQPVAAPAGSAAAPATPADYERVIHTALSEFDAGNFAEARALFEQAHAIRPSARTLRGMGIAAFELKHYVQARSDLQASLNDSRQPLTQAQRTDVQALIERAALYVGRVEIHVLPSDATLVLNGKNVFGSSFDLEVGDYQLTVSAPGYRDATVHVTIEGGKMQTLTLQLVALDLNPSQVAAAGSPATTAAAPPKQSVFKRWWFWTAAGAVVVGVVITAVALSADPSSKPLEHGDVGGVVTTLRSAP